MILQFYRHFLLWEYSGTNLLYMTRIVHFIGLNVHTEIVRFILKQFQVPTVTLTKPLTNNWFSPLFLIYFGYLKSAQEY